MRSPVEYHITIQVVIYQQKALMLIKAAFITFLLWNIIV